MKKVSILIATVGALACASNSQATMLYPDGVTSGVTLPGLIADGWTVLYNVPYQSATTSSDVASWSSIAGSREVFVGAIDNNGNVIVGATGEANQIFSQTSSTSLASSYSSGGLYWYNVPGKSFGFSPTANINLMDADLTGIAPWSPDDGLNALRLSWHLDVAVDGSNIGGWRAGSITDLNYQPTPDKIVLVAPTALSATAVPEPSTVIAGLLMVVPFVTAGLRRLRKEY